MQRHFFSALLALTLLGGALTGCHKAAIREKPLPDPLLTSKKPVEGRTNLMDLPNDHLDELPLPPPPPTPAARDTSHQASVVGMLRNSAER